MTAARWLHFASLFLLFGSTIFWVYMGREAGSGLPATRTRMDRLMPFIAMIVAASGTMWLAGSIANMTGDIAGLADPDTLHAFFFETGFGPLAMARLALFAVLVAVALTRIEARLSILSLSSGLLFVSQAWLGHAAEDSGTAYGALMIASYAIHVLFAAAWLGGLLPLALGVLERTSVDLAGVQRLLLRFSTMATVSVVAVLISGMLNAAFRVGVPTISEASSAYGLILVMKIGLVAGMLALAALNRFVLIPRLKQTYINAVTAAIAAEFALGILVLGAAALLGITPPPR